jgi:hypothetical protein
MWTLGHFCFGYLISRPLFGKEPLKPLTLLSIFFMAAVADSVHVYQFRPMMHSTAFFLPFTLIILFVLYKFEIFRRKELIPLFVASVTHVFGDILFGSFAPFAPFSYEEMGIFIWGSYFHISVEIILFALMLLFLILTGDLKKLDEVALLKSEETKGQGIFQDYILVIFTMVTLGQIGAIFYLDIFRGENFYNGVVYTDGSMWYISLLFAIAQIIFLFILIKWVKERFKKVQPLITDEKQ